MDLVKLSSTRMSIRILWYVMRVAHTHQGRNPPNLKQRECNRILKMNLIDENFCNETRVHTDYHSYAFVEVE